MAVLMENIFTHASLEERKIETPHVIEVGPESYDAEIHHTEDCPYEITFHDAISTVKKIDLHVLHAPEYQVRWLCTVGLDQEHYGTQYLIDEAIGLVYGIWLVNGQSERDYWGECDVEYDIEGLEGPVDERKFERSYDE